MERPLVRTVGGVNETELFKRVLKGSAVGKASGEEGLEAR